ncbi:MAG: DUF3592 domain-containing protein [Bdellovibrionales bacterium]|nr:DUF3592 domain-containing protein [Bdellovibrionales bacterium]
MVAIRSMSNGTKSPGIFGKLFGTLFFLVFLAAGSFFAYLVVKGFLYTLDTYSWNEVPTQIGDVTIRRNQKHDEDSSPYELSLTYSYTVGSETFTKDIPFDEKRFSSYEDADEMARNYPKGSTRTCFVDPMDPSTSLLVRESLLVGFVVLFPLIFVAVGGGGLYYLWFGSSAKKSAQRSIARSNKSQRSMDWVVWVVGGVFTLFGLIGTYFLGQMGLDSYFAQQWTPVPGKVLESSVIRHESSDDDGGTSYTYSVDIFYEYVVDGETYRGSRFDFAGGSSSGYDSKAAIVKENPSGKEITVFVNPENPRESAIQVGFSWFFLLVLFPLIFLVIGLIVLYSQVGGSRKREGGLANLNSGQGGVAAKIGRSHTGYEADGPTVLKPQASGVGKVVVMLLISLFWNGIVSVFVYQAYDLWIRGTPDWFLMLFLVPFVLIGSLLIFGVFYSILAAFNPVVELTLSTRRPQLGSELEIKWNVKGKSSALEWLSISLEAVEQVTYRRGTNTATDRHTCFKEEVTKVTNSSGIRSGSVRVNIPIDQMHTFEASNNKIIWKLHLQGSIPRWPDVLESFDLYVQPVGAA